MCGTNVTAIFSFNQEFNHRHARTKFFFIMLLPWPLYTNSVSLNIIGLITLDMICPFCLENNTIRVNKEKTTFGLWIEMRGFDHSTTIIWSTTYCCIFFAFDLLSILEQQFHLFGLDLRYFFFSCSSNNIHILGLNKP